ncbi:MAG TPA: hypothetical protein PK398_00090 [Candidatus Gracilibacteria bacterium]|nr:hypothetical protein [Candidatus Gracilibacteria bacterium]
MKKKDTLKKEVDKTVTLLIITLGILIVALSVVFLLTTGKKAELGYRLQQAREINEDLKDISQLLKAQVTNASTSEELEVNSKKQEMLSPDTVSTKYLLPSDNN